MNVCVIQTGNPKCTGRIARVVPNVRGSEKRSKITLQTIDLIAQQSATSMALNNDGNMRELQ